ncbi:MAG: hypothetical protein RBJ76_09355 [Stenomitos frigidus ULC029]
MTARMEHDELTEAAIAPLSVTTHVPTETSLAERLESVKAGLVGALTASAIFGALLLAQGWVSLRFTQFAAGSPDADHLRLVIGGAIAALSGFLFGITYRYIIRQDQNPHLKSGAVLAFGLVRGLALVEGTLHEPIALVPSTLLPLALLGAESLLLFAGTRLVLDSALASGWVKPFGALNANQH